MTDLSLMSAAQLADGYRCGEFSPEEATRAALDAVRAHDDEVNAFVLVDERSALAQAGASTRRWRAGKPVGPADGVPASIKDMLLTRGWPTLRGSTLVEDAQSWDVDAPAVARAGESGSVIIGKNTTPEFAWKGVTDLIRRRCHRCPWGADLTSGGSSGGAATAVGLGMGTWSVGTDGGGSARIPASFTGTVALKPTFGRIPIYPPSPYGTLAHAGPMTRTVADAALLLDLLTGPDSRDWAASGDPRCPTSTVSRTASSICASHSHPHSATATTTPRSMPRCAAPRRCRGQRCARRGGRPGHHRLRGRLPHPVVHRGGEGVRPGPRGVHRGRHPGPGKRSPSTAPTSALRPTSTPRPSGWTSACAWAPSMSASTSC